ncbi:Uncharacterised protein [Actinomyces bovis]|uniref:Transport-associated OB type 2 domain-containing protein n=1 Tax=Actinomyces bovis TaxID=1658 RepID=A0ABY1VRT5_9ACTO|nr:TOBE domain-containing protein [Actinomyces bovis]SPT54366.1 Uncharacterised protein [Actinomyces bovis]VEG56103.1 Uncharacterised protein [Actinomyces israelii]
MTYALMFLGAGLIVPACAAAFALGLRRGRNTARAQVPTSTAEVAPHPQAPDAAGPGSPVLDAPTSGTPEPGAASHQPVVAVGHSDAISLTLLDERSPRIRGNIGQIIENTYLGTTHRLVIETELGVMDTVVDAHAPEAEAAPGDAVRVTLNEDRLWALPAT